MIKLKGSVKIYFFTLEVDSDFKNVGEVEQFIEWVERMRRFHAPQKEGY